MLKIKENCNKIKIINLIKNNVYKIKILIKIIQY